MRNLKRVLSLTLASAMLFGMMVMGASAADKKPLTDLDKVTNKEAVNLMVDLGIIAGKPDGSFAPAETVDRATMAKLIYFIMMGTADESAFKGVNTGLTDVKGNWAEGFINYCYSVKIVAGTGDNAYNPNGKVTVASAAKMLLVALGYDSDASKYQNDPMWSVNITRDAQTAGLLKGIDQASSAELTRDNAAQMIYNALFANTVKPDFEIDQGIKYLKGYNAIKDTDGVVVTLATTNYNLKKFTGVVVGNEFAAVHSGASVQDAGKTQIFPYITTEGTTKGDVTATGAKTVKVATDVSMLGQEVVYYTHGKDNTESSSVTATGKTKEYTWTDSTINYIKFLSNGGLTDTNMVDSTNYVTGAVITPVAKDGVRFVDSNDDGKQDFAFKTAYFFSKVTKVDSTNITITGLGTRKLADVSGSADLAKDDYVNYAPVGSTGKATAEKAVEVAGTVTSLRDSSKKAVIDGNTYTVAATADKVVAPTAPTEIAKTYIDGLTLSKAVAGIFHLNKAGELALYTPTEEGSTSTAMYAYVTALNMTTSFSTTNIEAKVVLADGTQETVKIVDNTTKDKKGLYDTAAATDGTPTALNALVGVYPYTLNKDGEMVAGEKATTKTTIASAYTAGKPTMDLATTDILMDANTTVLFYDNSDASNVKISSYKGVNNVPGIANGKSVTPVVVEGKTFATFVLVEAVGETATAEYAYALGNGYAAQTSKGYEYNMVINGEKTTLTTKDIVSGMRIGNIYTYGVDKDDIATLSAPVAITGIGTVKSVADKYVVIGTDSIELATDYTVDDLTSTDKDGAIAPTDGVLAADSKIIYIVSGTKLVKAYVINDGKVVGVDGANAGALISVDGYAVTLTGTLTNNALNFKFTAPAGVAADGAATITVNGNAVTAPAEGKASIEGGLTFADSIDTFTVVIRWTDKYTETYTFNTADLTAKA